MRRPWKVAIVAGVSLVGLAALVAWLRVVDPVRDVVVQPPPVPKRAMTDPAVGILLVNTYKAVQNSPLTAERWYRLALAYMANGFPELAQPCFDQAIRLAPTEPRTWYHQGLMYAELQQVDEALHAFEQVTLIKPNFAPAYWRRGMIYLDQWRLDDAEREFQAAREIDRRDEVPYLGLARVHLARNDVAPAIDMLEDMLTWARSNVAYGYLLLGAAYRRAGENDKAESALAIGLGSAANLSDPWQREIHEFRPGWSVQLDRAVFLLRQNRVDEALEILVPLAEVLPLDPAVRGNLAAAYRHAGRLEQSLAAVEDALRVIPAHSQLLNNRAATLHAMSQRATGSRRGDLEADALDAVRAAIDANPASGEAFMLKGDILLRQRRQREAVEAYQESARCLPGDAEPRFRAGVALLHLQRWNDAQEILQQSVARDPNHVEAWFALANATIMQRDFAAARKVLDHCRSLQPHDARLNTLEAILRDQMIRAESGST